MTTNIDLTIILVNWNGSDDTINCLTSVHQSPYKNFNIIVVDNGSTKEEIIKLKESNLDFQLIETGENLGYTGGNNVGISKFLEMDTDQVLLLNNDTFVEPSALQNLVLSASSDLHVGILSPKILYHPKRNLVWSAGAKLNYRFLMGKLIGYKKQYVEKGPYDEVCLVDYVSGCAMLIKKKVILDIGLLHDDYFATCEDIDYCLEARKAGYEIKYEPKGTVWHIESASSGGTDSPQYVYYQTRNYYIFHSRQAENLVQLTLSQLYYFLYTLKRSLFFVYKSNWKGILGIFLGTLDFLRGKVGRQTYSSLVKLNP